MNCTEFRDKLRRNSGNKFRRNSAGHPNCTTFVVSKQKVTIYTTTLGIGSIMAKPCVLREIGPLQKVNIRTGYDRIYVYFIIYNWRILHTG